MPKFPVEICLPTGLITISPYSLASIGAATGSLGAPASTAWPAANRAIFIPFRVSVNFPVLTAFIFNGATVDPSYNLDIGIYTADGRKLASTGSTAQGTANVKQNITLVYTLGAGVFFMAMACDNALATFFRSAGGSGYTIPGLGYYLQASAFPLPATATFASNALAYTPVFGLSRSSV